MAAVVAGGTGDFPLVRHLVLRGSAFDIGAALAREVRRWFLQAPPLAEPILNRARRHWFERNWPQHYARMAGIAEVNGSDLLDDRAAATELFATPFEAGCSTRLLGTARDNELRTGTCSRGPSR